MKASELQSKIEKELQKFAKIEADTLKDVEKKAAKKGAKRLKEISPKKTGDYRKNWAYKKTEERSSRISLVIHNKEEYRLTHLLENGHIGIVHGRRIGKVKAIPHIKGVEEEVEKFIEKELGRKL